MENLVIIGSGPAGLTAAIYAARAGLSPLVIEGFQPGGQLMQTETVENYPGFPEGISGPDLMARMREQAEKCGARFVADECGGGLQVRQADHRSAATHTLSLILGGAIETRALIVATGATARKLGIPAEDKLWGRGVSGCAVCDGAFFKGKTVAVVGGGDTAAGDALYLARMCEHVYLIHRRDALRASKVMAERVMSNPKITPVWDSVVEDIRDPAKREVTGARVKNVKTGETSEIALAGIFVAIGHSPATAWLGDALGLDDEGYVVANMTRTTLPGVFAAGDVVSRNYKQAVIAASAGATAALNAEEYLNANFKQ
ncbi:MAG: thioredoxin-disulfide reductase [Kiritimatiellaeota bacterium]|nr:thioredoxin-disulfide reductase [Kiritimatiellota bacterium]